VHRSCADRLAAFGFLGGDAVRALDAPRGSTGNAGLLDQRAALQWVQTNVGP
jgi:carboxylesterase type B